MLNTKLCETKNSKCSNLVLQPKKGIHFYTEFKLKDK